MKTVHAPTNGTTHGASGLGQHRRPGAAGAPATVNDTFAQMLSGLGDSIQDGASDASVTATTRPDLSSSSLATVDSADSPSSPTQPPQGVDGQSIAQLLVQSLTPQTDLGAAATASGLTGQAASGGHSLGLAGAESHRGPGWPLGGKPELPPQAASRASIASGRTAPLTDTPGTTSLDTSSGGGTAAGLPTHLSAALATTTSPAGTTPANDGTLPADAAASATKGEGTQAQSVLSRSGQPDPMTGAQANPAADQVAGRPRLAPGRLVSLAARNPATVGSPAHSLARLQRDDDAATRSWHMGVPGQPGSGLATGEATATPTLPVGGIPAPQATGDTPDDHHPDEGSGQGQGPAVATDHRPSTAPDTSEAPAAAAPVFARSLDQAMQSLGAQVSLWTSQKLQHATMDLDTGAGQSLQVDVTMENGKVELQFRSDDAVTREAIRAHAPAALGDLLGRNGLDLAGLSVGSQGLGQRSGQDTQAQSPGGSPRSGQSLERLATPNHEPRARVIRSDRALDLYA